MIEIKNISKSYVRSHDKARILALDKLNLKIHQGEFVSIVGPSGAGKSTLVRLLIAEEKPDEGEILIASRNICLLQPRDLPYYRRKIGVIFQDFKLLPHRTVAENVAFALEASDVIDEEIFERVPKILELVGLTERADSYPDELSGGEKQRTAIARAMVRSPKILIADEPTGNLDPITAHEIAELLEKINRNGTTVLLATHNQNMVDGLQKRVVALHHGQVVADAKESKYIINDEASMMKHQS